ncbi:MAG: response regulator [Myxococcota bacterium]
MLRLDGHDIVHASAGAEALRWASEHLGSCDALLTDVVMPDVDGFALARALREQRPELPVVYMSGFAGDASTRRQRVERSVFLEKPVAREALQHALARVARAGLASEAG